METGLRTGCSGFQLCNSDFLCNSTLSAQNPAVNPMEIFRTEDRMQFAHEDIALPS